MSESQASGEHPNKADEVRDGLIGRALNEYLDRRARGEVSGSGVDRTTDSAQIWNAGAAIAPMVTIRLCIVRSSIVG